MEYEKGGEMARVLEKQAELIGQYATEENAQREWERKFNGGGKIQLWYVLFFRVRKYC